jgi:potassium voltage-gated channel KQT-like subfamily protein 1
LYCFETLRVKQTLMVQVARRSASVLKRRKSRNRMEAPSDRSHDGPSPAAGSVNDIALNATINEAQKDGESEVIYYMDEPHAPGN